MNAASNELNCSKQKSAIAASSCSTGFAVQSSNCFNSQVVSRSSDLAAEAESQTVLVSQQVFIFVIDIILYPPYGLICL